MDDRGRGKGPGELLYTGAIATESNPSFFLSAGEASGDHYGAQIIAELARRHAGASFFGLGGREMEAVGQERVVRAEDVAHMGITEVIRHAPKIYGAYRRLVGSIKKRRPRAAVLIDFPDVNLRLARELKALGIPVVYFVSPQLWAWKKKRLKWVQERVDRMMVIFPFEEPFYRNRGVNATFTGHPLAELPLPAGTREEYARRHGLNAERRWVALLPGSRAKEVLANLPAMIEAAGWLDGEAPARFEFLIPVASTISPELIDSQIKGWFSSFQGRDLTVRFVPVPDAREALFHARASVVASGTATVQAAVIGNPFIVVYRVSPTTFRLAKRLVSYPAEILAEVDAAGNLPIAMVNLIAGRRIVPELLQERFTAEGVAEALRPLLGETAERARMIEELAEMRRGLVVSERGATAQVADAVDGLPAGSTARGAVTS